MTRDEPGAHALLVRDDRAVSLVLGAMLLTGLALLAFVTYQTQIAPQLEEEAASQHVQTVARELADLAASIETDASNQSVDVAAHPLELGYTVSGPLGDRPAGGALTFDPESAPVRLDAHRLVVQRLNASERITQPETWHDVNGTDTIEDVERVVSLRIKLDAIRREMTGDHVSIHVEDAEGEHAGTFRVCVAKHSPDWDLHTVVKDADGTILYNNADSYFNNQIYEPFWINPMNPDYRFDQVLATATSPMTLEMQTEDDLGAADDCPGDGTPPTGSEELSAEYATTYLETTDAGPILQGGGGIEHTDYNRTFTGGRLAHTSSSPDHATTLTLANGPLVLDQGDGEIFRLPPRFHAGLAGNTVVLDVAVPYLTGDPGSTTGTSTAVLQATPEAGYHVSGEASNLTMNLTTAHPALWRDAWETKLEAAGLSGSTYEIAVGPGWARLDVWGLVDTDPGSETLDLFVRIDAVPVEIELTG